MIRNSMNNNMLMDLNLKYFSNRKNNTSKYLACMHLL